MSNRQIGHILKHNNLFTRFTIAQLNKQFFQNKQILQKCQIYFWKQFISRNSYYLYRQFICVQKNYNLLNLIYKNFTVHFFNFGMFYIKNTQIQLFSLAILIYQVISIFEVKENIQFKSGAQKIYGMNFGESNDKLYISLRNQDKTNVVHRYMVNETGPVLQKQYELRMSSTKYDKILEVNNQYLLVYCTKGNFGMEIFDIKNDKRLDLKFYEHKITSMIYSRTRNELFLFSKFGQVMIENFDSLIMNNNHRLDTVLSLNQSIEGQLSFDQRYLAIKSSDSSCMWVYDIQNWQIVSQYDKSASKQTLMTWSQSTNLLYIYDPQQTFLTTINPTSPGKQPLTSVKFSIPSISSLLYMRHINQTNELMIVYKKHWRSSQYYYDFYDMANYRLSCSRRIWYGATVNDIIVQGNDGKCGFGFGMLDDQMNVLFGRVKVQECLIVSNQGMNNETGSSMSNLTAFLTNDTASFQLAEQSNNTIPSLSNVQNNSKNSSSFQNTLISQPTAPTINQSSIQTFSLDLPKQQCLTQQYQTVLSTTLNNSQLRQMNKLPGSRKLLKPFFLYFSNLDDLWLYYYHERNYDDVLQKTFSVIQKIQTEKWKLFSFEFAYQDVLGLDYESLKQSLDTFKLKFTSHKYLEVEGHSLGYFVNMLNFLTTNCIIMLAIFLVGKGIYRLFAYLKIRCSIFFYRFTLWLYFIVFCLQGNVQFFSYLLGFEIKTISHKTFTQKSLTTAILLFNFFFVCLIFSIIHLAKYLYNDKLNIIYENCNNTQSDILQVTFSSIVRNFSLGMVHIGFHNYYEVKITLLVEIQLIFLSLNVISVSETKNSCLSRKFNSWINIFATMVRLLIIVTFLIEPNIQSANEGIIKSQYFSQYYVILFECNIFLWIVSIVNEFISILIEIKHFMGSKLKNKVSLPLKVITPKVQAQDIKFKEPKNTKFVRVTNLQKRKNVLISLRNKKMHKSKEFSFENLQANCSQKDESEKKSQPSSKIKVYMIKQNIEEIIELESQEQHRKQKCLAHGFNQISLCSQTRISQNYLSKRQFKPGSVQRFQFHSRNHSKVKKSFSQPW